MLNILTPVITRAKIYYVGNENMLICYISKIEFAIVEFNIFPKKCSEN